MKRDKKENKRIGNLGESIGSKYLEWKGFRIIDRNYLRKWGEIDIIAQKDHKVHFVEVKAVSYETKAAMVLFVSRGTWRPEDNVHAYKIRKLLRAVESWIAEQDYRGEWQIDVIAVKMVLSEKYATVKYIPNVIL